MERTACRGGGERAPDVCGPCGCLGHSLSGGPGRVPRCSRGPDADLASTTPARPLSPVFALPPFIATSPANGSPSFRLSPLSWPFFR